MSDLKLFQLGRSVRELAGQSMALERPLQRLIEQHLDIFLGARFLATEFTTSNGGRIDTLGIDENNCPVIIEYKREKNQNVINQGLFYLDWLMDHRGDFELLIRDRFGKEVSNNIEWGSPRLICVANDFTKYDEHAVNQMSRNIELVRYKRFEGDLLLLELVTAATGKAASRQRLSVGETPRAPKRKRKTVKDRVAQADEQLTDLYLSLESHLLALGDVQKTVVQNYIAFRKLRNFACVQMRPQARKILVYVKVDPDSISLVEGFTRDKRGLKRFQGLDLEITISSAADLDRAKPLLAKSYEVS